MRCHQKAEHNQKVSKLIEIAAIEHEHYCIKIVTERLITNKRQLM